MARPAQPFGTFTKAQAAQPLTVLLQEPRHAIGRRVGVVAECPPDALADEELSFVRSHATVAKKPPVVSIRLVPDLTDDRGAPDPQNSSMVEPPCRDLGTVGPSLFLGVVDRDELGWGAALGAVDYKIRRSTSRDFMLTHPVPDDTYLFDRVPSAALTDSSTPGTGVVFYYFVNATDGATTESDD